MRTLALALAVSGLALLAGCKKAPTDVELMTATCVESGEKPAVCSCISNAMATKLDPELFKATAQAIGKEKQNIETYIRSLPTESQIKFAVVGSDLLKCQAPGEMP